MLKIKCEKWPQEFEVVPSQSKLLKPGPPNLYFKPRTQPTVPANDEDSNAKPLDDGADPEAEETIPDHGWVWQDWTDMNEVDSHGAVARNDPFLNCGNERRSQWSAGQFFDIFFPWNYVASNIIPATNKVLMHEKLPESNVGKFRVFMGI